MPVLTTAPRLLVCRPSPTTTEFTVTTLPPATVALRVLRFSLLLLRLTLSLLAVFLLLAHWDAAAGSHTGLSSYNPAALKTDQDSDSATIPWPAPSAEPHTISNTTTSTTKTLTPALPISTLSPAPFSFFEAYIWCLVRSFRISPLGNLITTRLVASVPLPVHLALSISLLYLLSLRVHRTESILALRGLGVQTSESGSTYWGGTATRFIPTEKIQDILVNEAFKDFEVRYYLVVVVEGEEDLVVVFPGLLPRRKVVEEVWRGVRGCLYEGGLEGNRERERARERDKDRERKRRKSLVP